MEFTDQSLQFISNYYFQEKLHENSKSLTIIEIMLLLLWSLTISLFGFSLNLCFRKLQLIYVYIKKFDKANDKIMNLPSLIIISALVNVSLLVFQGWAMAMYHIYTLDIFGDANVSIPHIMTVIVGDILICIFLVLSNRRYYRYYLSGKKEISLTHILTAVSITTNIIFLGSYFVPYMLLAFVHFPFQVFFFYLFLIILLCCAYFLLVPIIIWFKSDDESKHSCSWGHACDVFSVVLFSLPVAYFISVMIAILELGSFTDFSEIKILLTFLIQNLLEFVVLGFIFYKLKQWRTQESNTSDNVNDGNMQQQENAITNNPINA